MLSFDSIVSLRLPRRIRRTRVGDGESDHQVAEIVVAAATDKRQPQRRAPREPFELM